MTAQAPVLVAGAGPAGLAAARLLAENRVRVVVCEQAGQVGGLARTEVYRGYRFDIGGHRFLTRVPEVQRCWEETLREEFVEVTRLSRIYYRGRFFDYPIRLPNVVRNVGAWESALIVASYARARARRSPDDDTFEQWVTNRFGDRLYRTFFKTYTEKVWGVPCSEIRADWAAQRIRGLTLRAAVCDALFRGGNAASLARRFRFPVLGSGQMWERFADHVVAGGGEVRMRSAVTRLRHDGRAVTSVEVSNGDSVQALDVSHVISSMPLGTLLERLDPEPPPEILEAGRSLRHRDFILIGLILDARGTFPDNWIYVHAPEADVGRIQNFGNWSAAMVPDGRTSLGLEYFCSVGDRLWSRSDAELLALAARELTALGLAPRARLEDGCVIRQPKAYPVYDGAYRTSVAKIRAYLARFANLQTIGRNGMHQYNNQDHSMLTGLVAARNTLGGRHDLWSIDTGCPDIDSGRAEP